MIRTFLSFSSLFPFLLFVVMAISMIAPRAASFAAPVAGLILLVAWYAERKTFLKPRIAEIAFMGGIPALAAISALWAIDPPFAIERAVKLLPMLIFGLFFIEAARQGRAQGMGTTSIRCFMALYVAVAAGVALEIFWDLKIYRVINDIPADATLSIVMMNRSMVVIATFFLPLMLILFTAPMTSREKWAWCAAGMLALGAGLIQTESQSAQLFFLLSVVLFFLFPSRLRAAWIATGIGVCILAYAAPWLAQWMFNTFPVDVDAANEGILRAASIPHRLEVWNFVATEALKHPWIGQGIEAIRYIKSERWLVLPNANTMLHPHNAPLQLWVEFGVIGITMGCALFCYILFRLWKGQDPGRRAGLAVSISMLAVMSTGYGLWQSWQIGLLIALTGLMIVAMGPGRRINP